MSTINIIISFIAIYIYTVYSYILPLMYSTTSSRLFTILVQLYIHANTGIDLYYILLIYIRKLTLSWKVTILQDIVCSTLQSIEFWVVLTLHDTALFRLMELVAVVHHHNVVIS